MKLSSMSTHSSALMLWASVASLLCAPAGVLGRAVPDPCPASCEASLQGWTQHHRMGDMSACKKPIRYNAEIDADTTDVTVHACTLDSAVSISQRSASASKTYTKRATTREVDFQIAKNSNGTNLSRNEIDMFVEGIDEETLENMSPGSSFAMVVTVSDREAAFAIFGNNGIHPPSMLPVLEKFGSRVMNGTSMYAAQHCGEDVPIEESIGIILDTSERDLNDMVDIWAAGNCITEYETEETWEKVSVEFRDEL